MNTETKRTTTVKKAIKEVTFTVVVTAKKINENGTLSGLTIKSVKGPNSTADAVSPVMSGGAMYLKLSSMDGIQVLSAEENFQQVVKKKLF
jgi:hypothetical protein